MDSRKLKGLGLPYGPKDAERRYWRRLGVTSGYLPTGLPELEERLPGGGIPRSKITEIYGESMSGKTTLCQRLVASILRDGGLCVWIDSEYALSCANMENFGVDLEKLRIIRPGEGRKVHHLLLNIVRLNCADLIVLDSLTAFNTDLTEKSHYSFQKEWMIYLREALDKSSTAFVFVSQTRERILKSGLIETVSCAWDLSDLCHLRIRLQRACDGGGVPVTKAILSGMAQGEVGIDLTK